MRWRRRITSGGCGGAATGGAGFGQRFAIYDPSIKQALTNRDIIWLHAVSVGEVNLCTQLIRALEPRVPNLKIVVSCTTTTGMAELRRRLPTRITKIYYPIDRRKFVRRALATFDPKAIVLVEAEIWPNFLWRARDLKIPAVPRQRPAVRPLLSALQKIRLAVPPAVRVVRRRRLPERGGRAAAARRGLPPRNGAGGGQHEI